jgi:hypothetical protein
MPILQNFFAEATTKSTDELLKAYLNIPEDKRGWSPMGDARSAIDQVAECALISEFTVGIIKNKAWPDNYDMAAFMTAKSDLAKDENALIALLKENTAKTAEAIKKVTDEDLGMVIHMMWGDHTISEVIAYQYWNASYHLGQINYIASMLGCLK